jgi:hypothetical protein
MLWQTARYSLVGALMLARVAGADPVLPGLGDNPSREVDTTGAATTYRVLTGVDTVVSAGKLAREGNLLYRVIAHAGGPPAFVVARWVVGELVLRHIRRVAGRQGLHQAAAVQGAIDLWDLTQ